MGCAARGHAHTASSSTRYAAGYRVPSLRETAQGYSPTPELRWPCRRTRLLVVCKVLDCLADARIRREKQPGVQAKSHHGRRGRSPRPLLASRATRRCTLTALHPTRCGRHWQQQEGAQEKQQQSRQLLDPDISRLNQTTMLEIKNILSSWPL